MTRSDPRIARTRDALQAALVALVSEKPFEAVTVQDIAARAAVGYATFFRHYPSREALLTDIADGLMGELLTLVGPLMRTSDTAAAARALTDFVEVHRALCQGLLVGANDAMRRDITRRAVAIASNADGQVSAWLPPALGIIHSVGAVLAILGWWLEHDPERNAKDVAEFIDRLVFAPLAAP